LRSVDVHEAPVSRAAIAGPAVRESSRVTASSCSYGEPHSRGRSAAACGASRWSRFSQRAEKENLTARTPKTPGSEQSIPRISYLAVLRKHIIDNIRAASRAILGDRMVRREVAKTGSGSLSRTTSLQAYTTDGEQTPPSTALLDGALLDSEEVPPHRTRAMKPRMPAGNKGEEAAAVGSGGAPPA
jgi:hypothetical protein